MKRIGAILAIASLILLGACQNPLVKATDVPSAAKAGSTGSLSLSLAGAPGASSLLSLAKAGKAARTILPSSADTHILSYSATGTGPSAATVGPVTSTNGSFNFPTLAVGAWSFVIIGNDSTGAAMVSGTLTVTIAANVSVTKTVTLAPVLGSGSLGLTVSWSGTTGVVTSISGALTPDGAGTAIPVTLTVAGTTASGTIPSIPTGNYLLVLNLQNGGSNVTSPRVDGVVIYNGKTSLGTFTLVQADFNYAAVTGVSFAQPSAAVGIGSTLALTPTIAPSNATMPELMWISDTPAVATVDQTGLVSGIGLGSAVITATSLDGNKSATCTVTVSPSVVGMTKFNTGLLIGGTEQLVALIDPAGASNPGIVWASRDTTVATVDTTGKVTAVAAGTTAITATSSDGMTYASCVVTVSATAVPVSGVTVTPIAFSLFNGQSAQLTNATSPTDATNQNVSWTSDKPAVASVDPTGLVTAVSPGSAVITVTTADGGKTATSTVYVSTATWALADHSMYVPWTGQVATSYFNKIATDAGGNAFAIGKSAYGFDFGGGIAGTAANGAWGNNSWWANLIVKFNSSGNILWAKTIKLDDASLSALTTDALGNCYVLGVWNSGYASADFTGGQVWGSGTAFILKFDPTGNVLWAQPLIRNSGATLVDLAVDGSGNLYIAGSISGTNLYQFVGGFNVAGTAGGQNALLAKCDPTGVVVWAKSDTQGNSDSWYSKVVVDASGNAFAAGYVSGGVYSFGGSSSVTAPGTVLVKYGPTGTTLWATIADATPYYYSYNNISNYYNSSNAANSYNAQFQNYGYIARHFLTIDGSGSLYLSRAYMSQPTLVKINADGTPAWSHALPVGSYLDGLAINSSGVVAAGHLTSGSFDFGNSVSLMATAGSIFYASFRTTDGLATHAEALCGDPVKSYAAADIAVSASHVYVAGIRTTNNNGASPWQKAMLIQY